MANDPKTIILVGSGIRREEKASVATMPGMLVSVDSLGVKPHDSAGQNALRQFAIEDELQGNGIDDEYSIADLVQFETLEPGAVVYGFLADGETVVEGNYLESNGDGDLRLHAADSAGAVEFPEAIVGQAREAVDLSGSSGADPETRRIRVEIA